MTTIRRSLMLNERGFTIFETFTSIALLMFLTVVIFGAIKLSRLIFDQSLINVDVHGNLKRTVAVMTRDLEEAKQGIPGSMGSCNIDNPSNVCVQSAALSFKVPESTDVGGTTYYKTIKYTFSSVNKTISRQEINYSGTAGTTIVIGRNITGATFYAESLLNMIKISLVGSKNSSTPTTVTTQVFLRNKS